MKTTVSLKSVSENYTFSTVH